MENKVEAEFSPKKPHVAFLPSPGLSHVTPLFELAKILVTNHGFHATFLNITTEASSAQNNLLHSPNLPPHLHIADLPPIDISNLVNSQTPGITHLCINTNESLKCLNKVLSQLQPNKPQALVIDIFCTQAFDACKDVVPNIPVFTFFTASARLLALSLFLPQLDRDVEGEFVDLPHPVQVPGCEPVQIKGMLDQIMNRKSDEHKWYLYHVSRLPMAAGILLNTWDDLEPVTVRALQEHAFYHNIPIPPVHPIGPVIKETEPVSQTGSECIAWLNKQPSNSVLFVSFGSGGILTTKQQNELAWGLQLSGQRFLWVVRPPSDDSNATSFFNAGNDDSNYVGSYLLKVFERFCRKDSRKKHVGHVMGTTSGDSPAPFNGGVFDTLRLEFCVGKRGEVPMIAWPMYAEQRMNAMMVEEEIGVGVKVAVGEGGLVGREEVERVVKMVMVDGGKRKAIKHKAEELKESAMKTLQVNGSSYESQVAFAKLWKDQQ
ncbi:hypothetical protein PIB30_008587 [Stylosanthes scabra]|uniref:Uncharacterized protein n=1 Tax=Stylosanthes scabra TaxID=79078 RepID=A0ABU6R6P4_9FABA|nr:hypothetical protein [Stylosanthes scabra]